jgi:hypothetical protein
MLPAPRSYLLPPSSPLSPLKPLHTCFISASRLPTGHYPCFTSLMSRSGRLRSGQCPSENPATGKQADTRHTVEYSHMAHASGWHGIPWYGMAWHGIILLALAYLRWHSLHWHSCAVLPVCKSNQSHSYAFSSRPHPCVLLALCFLSHPSSRAGLHLPNLPCLLTRLRICAWMDR